MRIPRIAFAVVGLHHPHAFFGQPHGHQASERRAARTVKIEDGFAFLAHVEHRGSFRLHAECGLHRLDRRFELGVLFVEAREMHFIQMPQKPDVPALQLTIGIRIRDVRNHLGSLESLVLNVRVVNHAPLVHRRQECRTPQRTSYRERFGRRQHDIAGQVFVLRTEAIRNPGTH